MLYFHIPFCRKACHYCNFHFSTTLRRMPEMVEALLRELEQRSAYLASRRLPSVYFGGGTPSLLPLRSLERFFHTIYRLFDLEAGAEITLEANPDDITPEILADWRNYTPINRLSIGIQSFHDADLQWMNRSHNARQAHKCIEWSMAAGFENLTVDLIYGAPTTSDAQWAQNVQTLIDYGIPHLSCYSLTVEEGTALGHFVKKGKAQAVDEEQAARQMEWLIDRMEAAGYEHYEISNFALPGRYAVHNSRYWQGAPYLGIGPSAHSYNGSSRQWNISNNALYIQAITEGKPCWESETLTAVQSYNEYVMTSLRTMWGCEKKRVAALGVEFLRHFEHQSAGLQQQGLLEERDGVLRLTRAGKLLADHVMVDLFFEQ